MIGMGKSFTQVGCSEFAPSATLISRSGLRPRSEGLRPSYLWRLRSCATFGRCPHRWSWRFVSTGRETVVQTGSPPTSHVSATSRRRTLALRTHTQILSALRRNASTVAR